MTEQSLSYCLPSDITPEQFLAEYWQKKPLLIKQGLPELIGMFEPDDIIGLSLDEEATARLIKQQPAVSASNEALKSSDYDWQVKSSPLAEENYAEMPEQWTVLVQNLEQWSPELGSLWKKFDFIPQWQRDDIMVSYAPDGGSVGKHYDEYDVFLAQGYGHRRWQCGKFCDEATDFIPNQPIRIFDDMGEIILEDVLEAGDVLYVPPKLSHNGVALGDSLTFSFGFRRPNNMQLLDNMTDVATTESKLFIPMQLAQSLQPSGQLTDESIAAVKQKFIDMLNSPLGDKVFSQAVCESVSKRQYDILTPEEMLTTDELAESLADGAVLKLDYSSRVIYHKDAQGQLEIYANGQKLDDLNELEKQTLLLLADGNDLNGTDLVEVELDSVMDWLENGWVWLDLADY